MKQTIPAALALLLIFPSAALSKPKEKEICLYPTKSGEVRQASSLNEVPRESRPYARCSPLAEQNNYLARPDEIKLEGSERQEQINSTLGPIQLRWPRKVESLFGRTPLRATTDAANTVSRALKNGAFPSELQNLSANWNIVFMDENLSAAQIPQQLISNCHPGWMTPPANIYIVAQRVAGGCGGPRSSSTVADSTLGEVLIHEMGHAVEHYLLKQRGAYDRLRAEGFATWFEEYAAQFSSIVSTSELKQKHSWLAKQSLQRNPQAFNFSGSGEDYARGAMYFRAINQVRGLSGLTAVYQLISNKNLPFQAAIKEEFNWDDRRLNQEVLDAARK